MAPSAPHSAPHAAPSVAPAPEGAAEAGSHGARQLQARLEASLRKQTGLEAEVAQLRTALEDTKRASNVLARCQSLGLQVALDDFGTGFSSLTYLRTLPVDVIKIDQSFVRNMLTDANDRAIVESVIFLAQRFDHPVLAEGVETMDHAAALRDMGCNLVQGYGIARPMPSGEVLEWLQNWRRQVESRKEIQQLQAASEQGEGI